MAQVNAAPVVGAAAAQDSAGHQQTRFTAPGQQIFALKYRQAVLTPRPRSIFKKLKGTSRESHLQSDHVWKIFGDADQSGQRASKPAKDEDDDEEEEEEEEEEVYVEAKLVDTLDEVPYDEEMMA